MSGSEHDPELEAFLKRRSPIHRRLADFDHAEPSVELDRLVLSRAREAIDSPAQPPMFRTARWAMPVGLAATILIAFTVVLNIDRRGHPLEKPVATAKAEHPAAPVAQLTTNRGEGATQDARSENKAPPLLASAPSGHVPPLAPSAELKSANVPRTAASAETGAATTETESDSRASKAQQRPARNSMDPPLVASGSAISAVTDRAAVGAAPAPPAAPPAYQASAESWLREINRLRAAGKTAEAERELTAFRQAYPTHPGYSVARPPTR